MVDVLNRCYNMQHGSIFTAAIPTNIYGRHDNFHLDDSHVIPGARHKLLRRHLAPCSHYTPNNHCCALSGLIHKVHLAKEKGEDFVAWGTGSPLRQFIIANDLGRLMVRSLILMPELIEGAVVDAVAL